MGTFDPIRKVYRKDYGQALVAIPDICGYRKPYFSAILANSGGQPLTKAIPVYIEVKNVKGVEKKRKLVFKCKITDQQKEFLLRAHRSGCLAGVAFTLEDALAIAHDDPVRYPRHPRTYLFLDLDENGRRELADRVAEYEAAKKALSRMKQDPVAAATTLAHGLTEPED